MLLGVLDIVKFKDKFLADSLLDRAIENHVLRRAIVALQCHVSLDRPAVNRLLRALKIGQIPLEQFGHLARYGYADNLAVPDLCDLMFEVLKLPGGANAVVDGLGSRFFGLAGEGDGAISPQLKSVGIRAAKQWFLDRVRFGRDQVIDVHNLERVLDKCVDDCQPPQELDDLVDAFFDCLMGPYVSLIDSNKLQGILARRRPFRFLDIAFRQGDVYDVVRDQLFVEGLLGENSLTCVEIADLLAWCRQGNYEQRLATLAKYIFPFSGEMEVGRAELSTQARVILDETDDVSEILSSYACSVRPSVWRGSMADIIARRLPAFERLLDDPRPKVREAAGGIISDMRRWEAEERQWEKRRDTAQEQEPRFE